MYYWHYAENFILMQSVISRVKFQRYWSQVLWGYFDSDFSLLMILYLLWWSYIYYFILMYDLILIMIWYFHLIDFFIFWVNFWIQWDNVPILFFCISFPSSFIDYISLGVFILEDNNFICLNKILFYDIVIIELLWVIKKKATYMHLSNVCN